MSDNAGTAPPTTPAKPASKYINKRLLDKERAQRWAVYHERNQLVALLARLLPGSHRVAASSDSHSEPDRPRIIRELVCVHLPDGSNLTWHYSPEDAHRFQGLPYGDSDWDGHLTDEKYARMAALDIGRLAESISTHKTLLALAPEDIHVLVEIDAYFASDTLDRHAAQQIFSHVWAGLPDEAAIVCDPCWSYYNARKRSLPCG